MRELGIIQGEDEEWNGNVVLWEGRELLGVVIEEIGIGSAI